MFHTHAMVYGHGVENILVDARLSLTALMLMFCLQKLLSWERLNKALRFSFVFLLLWPTLIYMPNAAYEGFEIRHIFLVDNVADNLESPAIALFICIAMFGSTIAVAINLLAVRIPFALIQNHPVISHFGLSFFSALGTSFGYLDYNSIDALYHPEVLISAMHEVLHNRGQQVLIIGITIALSLLSITTDYVFRSYRKTKALKGRKEISPLIH